MSQAALIAEIGRFLSRGDFFRSIGKAGWHRARLIVPETPAPVTGASAFTAELGVTPSASESAWE
jgi:hypothetical protein